MKLKKGNKEGGIWKGFAVYGTIMASVSLKLVVDFSLFFPFLFSHPFSLSRLPSSHACFIVFHGSHRFHFFLPPELKLAVFLFHLGSFIFLISFVYLYLYNLPTLSPCLLTLQWSVIAFFSFFRFSS
ncbi:hypothetical protein DFH27DRAFT_235353 [Peziza echinospora]|nr:hypothetical protein DFH27DRAFT_235353 [Peziza echinospora]